MSIAQGHSLFNPGLHPGPVEAHRPLFQHPSDDAFFGIEQCGSEQTALRITQLHKFTGLTNWPALGITISQHPGMAQFKHGHCLGTDLAHF